MVVFCKGNGELVIMASPSNGNHLRSTPSYVIHTGFYVLILYINTISIHLSSLIDL